MPPTTPPVPRPCACTAVRRTSRVLARAFDAALVPVGLNITQLAVLRAVERHAGEPLTRVADDLCMDRTSLYRAVTPLQRAGWLRIVAGPDARSRTAEFTARGKRLMRTVDLPWARMQTAIIARFGRRQWAALVAELGRLADCARAAETETTDP